MSRNLTPSQLVRQCEVCGKDFVTERFAVNAGYGRFCGRVCGGIGRRVERTPIKERFEAMVNKDGPEVTPELGPCWVWTGAVNRGGNGKIGSHGKTLLAHRLAYEWEFGAIPEGFVVSQRCKQPLCVRGSHLFIRDPSDASDRPLPSRVRDLTSREFGQLVVLRFAGHRTQTQRNAVWLCRCSCGVEKIIRACDLLSDRVVSCGCRAEEIRATFGDGQRIHGMCQSPEYFSWQAMKSRCNNPKNPRYADYGGRGIHVCDRWRRPGGFEAFFADMGKRPTDAHSLDRIDVNGPYSPENCRWATDLEQKHNQRKTARVEQFTTEELLVELRRRNTTQDHVED